MYFINIPVIKTFQQSCLKNYWTTPVLVLITFLIHFKLTTVYHSHAVMACSNLNKYSHVTPGSGQPTEDRLFPCEVGSWSSITNTWGCLRRLFTSAVPVLCLTLQKPAVFLCLCWPITSSSLYQTHNRFYNQCVNPPHLYTPKSITL